ncbi:MAG TPA: hypothetical protein VK012_00125 [Gemmatimonadales bacterium]|nr:hypothetical protein [Gemmatimonadales bacterium]
MTSDDRDRRLEAERGAADAVDREAIDPTWQAAWETEDNFWHENFSSRPYTIGADYYERFRPAYRYGFEAAGRLEDRPWEEIEAELEAGWDRYEHRIDATSTWHDIRDAVRDAWDRARGRTGGRSGGGR